MFKSVLKTGSLKPMPAYATKRRRAGGPCLCRRPQHLLSLPPGGQACRGAPRVNVNEWRGDSDINEGCDDGDNGVPSPKS